MSSVCSVTVERLRVGLVSPAAVKKEGVSKYRPTKDTLVYNFYHFVGGTNVCPPVNILIECNMENIHQLRIKLHYLTACHTCVPLQLHQCPDWGRPGGSCGLAHR